MPRPCPLRWSLVIPLHLAHKFWVKCMLRDPPWTVLKLTLSTCIAQAVVQLWKQIHSDSDPMFLFKRVSNFKRATIVCLTLLPASCSSSGKGLEIQRVTFHSSTLDTLYSSFALGSGHATLVGRSPTL